jgi:hypothetical protein
MDQFTLMAETLTGYNYKFVRNYVMEDEEATNESLALVESTLLHGYTITDCTEYKTTMKRVTERKINA